MDRPVPFVDFLEVPVAVDRWFRRVGRAAEISAIEDCEAMTGQGGVQAGNAQSLRSHRSAAIGGAHIGWRADQSSGPRDATDHEPSRLSAALLMSTARGRSAA